MEIKILLKVLHYKLACDGKTWACASMIDYYLEPEILRSQVYWFPDPIHMARLDKADVEYDRRYNVWQAKWWRRIFTRCPLFMDVWRDLEFSNQEQSN